MATVPGARVDWQLECKSIKERGKKVLEMGKWTDCTFIVGTEPNQVEISAHKLILAMASPVFEAMFYGGLPETNGPIHILDVQIEAFKALLEYIYSDSIIITSFDRACELCYGAKKYMLPNLVKECTRYLWSDLNPKNACRAYEFACLFEEHILMDRCIQLIKSGTKEILYDNSFLEVDLSTIITVFSMDYLSVDSELDLFEAIERYAKAQERRNSESSTPCCVISKSPVPSTSQEKVVTVDSSAENSPQAELDTCKISNTPECSPLHRPEEPKKKEGKDKPTIRNALEKIRFLTLTPQQFAEGPAKSPLLSESEAFAVLMNILSSNPDVPMPHGFSTSRVPRKDCSGFGANMSTIFTVDTPSPVLVEQYGDDASSGSHARQASRYDAGASRPFDPSLTMNELRERDGSLTKMYCQRPVLQHTECYNSSILDCSVTFMVDRSICMLGVQVPTQTRCEDGGPYRWIRECPPATPTANASVAPAAAAGYSELLYAHLLDSDGARLTYTHFTSRVPYNHLLDIMFNRPVYIQKNKIYKVGIVFNKLGWYPLSACTTHVATNGISIRFALGPTADSQRDGLVRSIIYTY